MTEPDGTVSHTATLQGQLTPGDDLYPLARSEFYSVQRLTAAVLTAALGDRAEFYTVVRTSLSEPAYRERWSLEVGLSGPSLTPLTEQGHLSGLTAALRVYPMGSPEAGNQLTRDPADTRSVPYAGQLCGLAAALWLRHKWGPGSRELTVGSYGTLTFAPEELIFGAVYAPDPWTTVDYAADLPAALGFEATPQQDYQPGVWLSMADEPEGTAPAWKISYSTPQGAPGVENRWDDPAEPCPVFAPLPVP